MRRRLDIDMSNEVHAVYQRMFTKPMRYNVWYGGKWTGKTYAISLSLVLKQLISGDGDMLVLRKYNKDHTSSTFKTLKKAINYLGKVMGEKKHYFEKHWKFTKSPSLEVTYLPTGAKIYFAGMDDPGRVAGITTDDVDRIIRYVWYEEPIEVADMKTVSKIEQQVLAKINFEVVEDSALRPPKEKENTLVEIHLTMNSWKLLTSWVYEKFNKLFRHFDYESEELVKELETNGYKLIEDSSFMDGQGARVVHTSYVLLKNMGVLPKTQLAKHKLRKLFAKGEYKLISLGIPEEDETFILKKYKKDCRDERDYNWENAYPFEIGVDIGQLKDYSVLEMQWDKRTYNYKTKQHEWAYDDLVYKGELVIKETSLNKQARIMIEWLLDNYLEDYPEMMEYGITFSIHLEADFKIVEPLAIMKEEIATERRMNLDWIRFAKAPSPNKKVNWTSQRAERWKQTLQWRKLVIARENKLLRKTLFNMEIDKNGNRIEDKRVMDAINAAEHPLNRNHKRRTHTWLTQAQQKSLLNKSVLKNEYGHEE